MKHKLLRKPAYKNQPLATFYLWDILAQGIVARLERINLQVSEVAIIGPSASIICDYLKAKYPSVGIDCFAANWEISDKKYDLFIINGVLAWFDAAAYLLEDIFAALQAKGTLCISMLGPETLWSLQKGAQKMGWTARIDTLVDMHHWGDCLLQTGFSDPVLDREDVIIHFKKPGDWFSDWQKQGLQDPSEPACHYLITNKQWQRFLSIIHNDDKPWEANFECLFGLAYKPEISRQKMTAEGVEISLEVLKRSLKGD